MSLKWNIKSSEQGFVSVIIGMWNIKSSKKLCTKKKHQQIPKCTSNLQKVFKSTKKYQQIPTSMNIYIFIIETHFV